jgi:multidrug efflux pump subunit AcrA (membrane-fusion protein)
MFIQDDPMHRFQSKQPKSHPAKRLIARVIFIAGCAIAFAGNPSIVDAQDDNDETYLEAIFGSRPQSAPLDLASGSTKPGDPPNAGGRAYVGDLSVTFDGFTQPKHEIMLASDEAGRIASIDVVVGQQVSAGQIVARLENAVQAASLRTAQVQVDMVGEKNAARVELELNELRAEKLRSLAAKNMARPDELRRAEADLKIARARVASMEEQHQLRLAEWERAKVLLDRRLVKAPMNGIVSELFLSPGESVSPSTPSVMEILVVDQLIAIFDVPVQDTFQLQIGHPVRVRLQSGTVQVRVTLDNADGRLLSGDRCTLQILESRRAQSASLPGSNR